MVNVHHVPRANCEISMQVHHDMPTWQCRRVSVNGGTPVRWSLVEYPTKFDDFLEMLPLFQSLAHKAMRERHWDEIMRITGTTVFFAETRNL